MQEGFCVSLAFESSTLDSLGYVTLHCGASGQPMNSSPSLNGTASSVRRVC